MKIGILLPIAETDSGTILRYKEVRDAALRLERDRFDSIWIVDHLLFEAALGNYRAGSGE